MNPVEMPAPILRGRSALSAVGATSALFPGFAILLFLLLTISKPSYGQIDSTVPVLPDSIRVGCCYNPPDSLKEFCNDPHYFRLSPSQKKTRAWIVGGGTALVYTATMAALYSTWYKDYPQTPFHTFNDFPEWQQMDKVGHLYSAYIESRASMELWRWAGVGKKKRIWIGGISAVAYQTMIEVFDGFSEGWGWSWGDIAANFLGSGLMVAQEFGWDDQRIKLKFSFHIKNYTDVQLNKRSDGLFGDKSLERMLKDYNGQTYWASANLRSFLPKTRIPPWLGVSVGYGAEGMFGGRSNIAIDESGNIVFDRGDIKRYRQWYLAPDIDMSKIKTNSRSLKFIFTVLSAFKFPLPALEFSNGKVKAHAIMF